MDFLRKPETGIRDGIYCIFRIGYNEILLPKVENGKELPLLTKRADVVTIWEKAVRE